ncbi:MAG: hypothetical protein JNM55_07700 [Anaerolineales bacterium]|nr:hypothetical protein [Anaerolineales bacterium]
MNRQTSDFSKTAQPLVKNYTANEYLNAFRILNPESLIWSVSTYSIVPINGDTSHSDRGKIKNLAWELRSAYKSQCKGLGFILDIDEFTIVTPSTWQFPKIEDFNGYRVTPDLTFQTDPNDSEHRRIIAGILREGIKLQFKQEPSNILGDLWQDYGNFCQMPDQNLQDQEVIYCRGFQVSPEILNSGIWCLKTEVYSKGLDALTIGDYYSKGQVKQLTELFRAKRANRLTRSNLPSDIRVWCSTGSKAEVLELDNPDEILTHENLSIEAQKTLSTQQILCKRFGKTPLQVLPSSIRLILDTQTTQDDHSETIIDPNQRLEWYSNLQKFFDGMSCYGVMIELDKTPISIRDFEHLIIPPPTLKVRTSADKVGILRLEQDLPIEEAIKTRASQRARLIRQNGYLEQRPINPLLAFPSHLGSSRANRLQKDLNWIINNQGLDFKFGEPFLYSTVEEIATRVEKSGHDALFAVLPEGESSTQSEIDTHEKIKRQIPVPSQCIHHNNTLPGRWVDKSPNELKEKDNRLAKKVENRYRQCVLNLLVKHHWVPFAPSEAFSYNVHVAIDVGGRHNNRVMACIGYGFSDPTKGLLFLPKEIQIDTQKAEPIPTSHLFNGLLTLFDELKNRLAEGGIEADFSKVLFFRDGQFRGQGDVWNEFDALEQLHKELLKQKLIKTDSLWTATEVSKRAENWRVIKKLENVIDNPLVGTCVFPFNDEKRAIVCTTGRPYLTQGTSAPLVVNVLDVYGESNKKAVLKDLVWEADMCFTKLDMGMSLPWILHVADTGALQQSKAYKITGITV